MGTLQSTREPIAVMPQTNWGQPYRRRSSSLSPVSNMHLCLSERVWKWDAVLQHESWFRASSCVWWRQPFIVDFSLYWTWAESHWGSGMSSPSQNLIHSSALEKAPNAIRCFHHFPVLHFSFCVQAQSINSQRRSTSQRDFDSIWLGSST